MMQNQSKPIPTLLEGWKDKLGGLRYKTPSSTTSSNNKKYVFNRYLKISGVAKRTKCNSVTAVTKTARSKGVLDASGLPNTASDYEKALEAIKLLTENVRRGPLNCATIKCAPRALIA